MADDNKIFVIKISFISRAERDRAAGIILPALDGGNIHCSGVCLLEEADDGETA